ncbi:MAG: Ig-like domain-containing protein [Candidatus Amulumruptor caecigallinarius]|nr:Ig-like domain-containing protein [Candidatus Amulumruptor caecigallinarius]MCM1397823.1 Ig-like domain-containing protein [Candidatus Amulumruptor caecigallinarius]MCM1454884.1 Ig-like domain-containing protein [bacterium]
MRHSRRTSPLHLLPLLAAAILVASCATIGTPEGGPRDLTPPVVVKTSPAEGQTAVTGRRIQLTLNKNVQLDDAFNKVVVSPAQKTAPQIRSNAKGVTVELRDTLMPNTTYTIDFADAIKDLNEGNILDGFSLAFSTGDSIDSLRISGLVLEARNLEPAQGIIVGAYSNLADTAFTTLPMERIAKTNALGQFTLLGLKALPYRLFAINDLNRNYRWDRSEDIAFCDSLITPSVTPMEYADTIAGADGRDSVVIRTYHIFRPDNVLLTWFNENYTPQYIKEYGRPARNIITLELGAHADSMARVIITAPDSLAGLDLMAESVIETSATLDTMRLFIRNPRILATDSIMAAVSILRPDSLEQLTWQPDTLRFLYRAPRKSKADLKREEEERRRAEEDSIARGDSIPAPPPPTEFITFNLDGTGAPELDRPLRFTASEPLDTLRPSMVHMHIKRDTLWVDAPAPVITPLDSLHPLNYLARYDWKPQTTYRLTIDSAAVTGIYGLQNNRLQREFTTKALSDYGKIIFRVTGPDSIPAIVELLDAQDKPLRRAPVTDGRATFEYLAPGTYFARIFLDRDSLGDYGNGHAWGGDFRQPDEVYYFPKKIDLKKNWDIDQPWDIYALPLDLQKPFAIKKNKPKNAVAPPEEPAADDTPLPPGVYAPEE